MLSGMADDAPASSGGSEGTTDNVFRQLGHKKQFRAHLPTPHNQYNFFITPRQDEPILLSSDTCTGNLEQAIRTIIATDFDTDASITSYSVAFLAKKEGVKRVKAV